MKYLKSFFAAILVICLLTPNIFAAETDVYDVEDEAVLEAISVLNGFGVMSLYSDNSFRGFEKVTRRDMAILISEMMGNETGMGCDYIDVSEDDAGYEAIGFVTAKRIMVGFDDGKFRPDSYITGIDAVKTVVSALGYDIKAKAQGGYPNGYLAVASELKLPTGFNMSEEITKNDLVLLLYEAYEAPILIMDYDNGLSYSSDDDVTMLSYYHDIYKYKGIVDGNYLTGLNTLNNKAVTKNHLSIDGAVYDCSLEEASGLLGYYVEYYLDESDDGEIVSIIKSSKNEEFTVDARDIAPETTKTRLEYYAENNKSSRHIKISPYADFIYNLEAVLNLDEEDLFPAVGNIRAIDNNSDGECDVVFIEDYETIAVERVSAVTETIFNKYEKGGFDMLDLSEEAGVDIIEIEKNGEPAEFSQILPNDILSVLRSKSGSIVRIKASDKIAEGVLRSFDTEENTLILDDGNEIYITDALLKGWEEKEYVKPPLGVNVTIYLDVNSNAAFITFIGKKSYGFLRKAYFINDDPLREECVKLRIFSVDDGTWNDYYTYKNLKINDKKPDNAEAAFNIITEKSPVRFQLNGKGEVTALDFPEVFADSKAQNEAVSQDKFRASPKQNYIYRMQNTSLDSQFYMNDDVKILYVPQSELHADNEKYYKMETTSAFTPDWGYTFQALDYDDEKFTSFIIHYGEEEGASSGSVVTSPLVLVNSVNDSATEDNELVKELVCIISGRKESIFTSPDTNEKLDEIRPGDIIQIAMDDDGRLSELEVTYERASGEETRTSPITNFHDRRTIIPARVTKVGTKTISITTTGGDYTFKKSGNVAIFDEDKKGKGEAGTFDDINVGDFVVMRYRESSLQDTVVYK